MVRLHQNSFWQAGNREASSPFRETNYQPELMAVTPLNFNVLGMHASFLNLGMVHQSNGQASTLSRSWNRVYAQVGLERAGFTVLGRVWKRINEAASDDNNPDIVDYLGRGDLATTYAAAGTIIRPRCAGTSRPSAVRSSSAGLSRWPATSRVMLSTFQATARA